MESWQRRNIADSGIVGSAIAICILAPLFLYQFSHRWAALSVIPFGAALPVQLRRAWQIMNQRKPPTF